MVSNVTYGDVFGIGLFATALVLLVDCYYTDYSAFIELVQFTCIFGACAGLITFLIIRGDESIIRKK